MAKRLNVELGFTADTSQAKRQIDDLVSQLQKIQMAPSKLFDDQDLKDASKAAQELQMHIQNAFNANTGKLDLTKFSESLSKSNTSLTQLRTNLNKAGDTGRNAFAALTTSISQADAPMLRLNGRIGEFVTTLKNSARWQISSNILHGFESSLASAFSYAKNLDESLNNIRIVTGQNTDQMAAFAEEANKTAKALSTTTTNYTDASLIYYQQGLSDEEVKKRTDITVKMANAAQESADQVSQYMTAIWENYYDGSEALESYADKITALGAATASSSKEIANGLNKFVSIGKQIGLSYDYATAALTTIIAKTRQSEDVVGTALKTIFARIQGFNLGETADDGVTLNKYSSALASIGVNVLDVNGKMKDMDTILDETAAKWGSLSTAQQNALSQTVAGVRQYTQFSTLMNYWDFMKENLQTIKESGGALEEQANIYAEGWEAARKRVKASLEDIYDSLIDREGMTTLNNALADTLDILGDLIDGFGGLKGILLTISGFVATKMAKEMPAALTSIGNTLNIISGKSQTNAQKMLNQAAIENRAMANNYANPDDIEGRANFEGIAKVSEMKAKLAEQSRNLSKVEQEEAQKEIALTEARYKQIESLGKLIAKQKEALNVKSDDLANKLAVDTTSTTKKNRRGKQVAKSDAQYSADLQKNTNSYQQDINQIKELSEQYGRLQAIRESVMKQSESWEKESASLDEINQKAKTMIDTLLSSNTGIEKETAFDTMRKAYQEFNEGLTNGSAPEKLEELKQKLLDAMDAFALNDTNPFDGLELNISNTIDSIIQKLSETPGVTEQTIQELEKLKQQFMDLGKATQQGKISLANFNEGAQEGAKHTVKFSEGITTVAGSMTMAISAAQNLANAINKLKDGKWEIDDLTSSISALTSLMFTIPQVIKANAAMNSVLTNTVYGAKVASIQHTIALQAETAATNKAIIAGEKLGAVLLANPFTVILTVLAGVTAALTYFSNKAKEAAEAEQKIYDESIKKAEESQEKAKTIRDAAKTYEEAKEAYEAVKDTEEDSTEAKKAFDDATRNLADSLNEQYDSLKNGNDELERANAEVAIATGNYKDLEAAIRAANKARLEEQKSEALTALRHSQSQFIKDMGGDQETIDYGRVTNDKYNFTLDDYSEKDQSESDKYFVELLKDNIKDSKYISYSDDGLYSSQLSVSSKATTEDLAAARAEVQNLVTELESAANGSDEDWEKLTGSNYYQGLIQFLNNTEDSYQKIADAIKQVKDAEEQLAYQNVLKDYAISDKEVKNGQDYLHLIKDIAAQMAKEDLIKEGKEDFKTYDSQSGPHVVEKKADDTEETYAERYAERVYNLNAQQYTDEFYESGEEAAKAAGLYSDAAAEYEAAIGKINTVSDEKAKKEAQSFFEKIDPEDNKYFVEIDFDSGKTRENYEKQLEVLKAQDTFKVNLDIGSSISEAAKAIKDGKLDEVEDMFDWGKNGLINFQEFSEKSTSEQMEYLVQMGRNAVDNLEQYKQQAINVFTEAKEAYEKQADEYEAEGNTEAAQAVQNLANNLQIVIDKYGEYKSKDVDLSDEIDENVLKQMDDLTKFNTLMSTTQQLSGDLQQELANMIATMDNFTLDQKFQNLAYAVNADKISLLDLESALNQLISDGDVSLNSLQDFFNNPNYFGNKDSSVVTQMYTDELQVLAETYSNCNEELRDYQEALQMYNSNIDSLNESIKNATGEEKEQLETRRELLRATYDQAEANLELSVRAGEDGEKYDVDPERIELMADTFMDEAKNLESVKNGEMSVAEAAENMARAQIRLNDSIEDLYGNWEDYQKIMDLCNDTSKEGLNATKKEIAASKTLSSTFSSLKSNVAGLLDVTTDMLGDDWILSNMDDIKAAAEGNVDALQRLQENAVVEILVNTNLDEIGYDVDALSERINEIPPGELSLEDAQFMQELVWAMQQAGMASDEIQSALSGIGISCDLQPMYDSLGEAISVSDVMGGTAGQSFSAAYASTAGVDSQMVTQTDTAEDEQTYTGFNVTMHPNIVHGNVPVIRGASFLGFDVQQVPTEYVTYSEEITPTVDEEKSVKQNTAQALKFVGGNKSSGGNISRANSPGGSNRSGGSGGGGGRKGGGGRGSGSTPRAQRFTPSRQVDTKGLIKDNKKKLKDEQERYHLINSELKMISKNLADIDQIKSRAFGKNKLNAMKAENKELTIQAKKQAELLAQTKEYLKQDRKRVEALGATIGNDGSITNYDALTQGWVKDYNKGIKSWAKQQKQSVKTYDAAVKAATDKFNASDRGDAAKEAYDAEVEKAKQEKEARDNRIERFKKDLDEEYEEKKEAIEQYEETAEKERDEALKEQQIKDQIYDNELEIIQYEIQLKVDVSDASVKILEELFDQLGDDADKAADRIANLQKQTEQYVNQADYYKEGIEKILRHAGANDDLVNSFLSGNLSQSDIEQLGALGLTEGDAEALKDYQEKLLDLNQQYRDLKDEMMNEVSSAFDSFMDDLDRTAQKIEHLQKVTETYKNIIDIVGKKILDPTGTLSNRLNRTSFEQARSLTQASKSELELAEKSLAKAKKTRAKLAARYGDDDQIVKDWDKQVKELEDKRDEAYENWLSNWEAECQAARDIYEDSMNTILTNFESKISGLAGSLDALSDAYERQSKIDEVYVDDYEKIYQLSKLSRQINASIDDTTQIKNKQQLKKLQEEINKTQEQGVKMSQYDLDVLQKKYDLEVARQQLEEAQNAKTKVTMQRDSEGNYGYVYTADSKAVADAEQNYEDKLHELQVLNSDYIKQLQGDMIQLQQECQNALQNFAENFKGSPEEYAKGVQAILDQYQVLMNAKYQQMGNAINNNKTLYENDWKAYSEATGYKISVDEDYIDKWGETNISMITGYKTMGKAMEAWKSACEQTAKDSITAYQTWYEDTDTALKDGGTSMEDFKGTAEDVLTDVKEKTDAAAKSAKDMSTAYQTSFSDIITAAQKFCKDYKEEIEPAIALNDRLAKAIAKVLAEASKADSETNTGDTSGSDSGSGSGNGNGNTDNSANGSGTETATPSQAKEIAGMTAGVAEEPKKEKKKLTKETKYGVALAIINGKDNHYGWGEDPERAKRLKAKFGASNGIQALINSLYREGKVQNGSWVGQYSGLKEEDLSRFAYSQFNTGGYTGVWGGNQGKLAILDSKEIVLNKEDTENFLNAVDIVREIANTIDLNAASASNGFARLFAAAGIKTAPNELQQEVHITAEFPNVTNKNEILDAFDNVINLASQYANRK